MVGVLCSCVEARSRQFDRIRNFNAQNAFDAKCAGSGGRDPLLQDALFFLLQITAVHGPSFEQLQN